MTSLIFAIYYTVSVVMWSAIIVVEYEDLIVSNCKCSALRVPYAAAAICLFALIWPLLVAGFFFWRRQIKQLEEKYGKEVVHRALSGVRRDE